MKNIFLDPGHGGRDPGAVGNNLKEKDINLSIAKKVGNLLSAYVNVYYSRENDKYVSLTSRVVQANKLKADIFVSFHVNSAANVNARGFEVWTSKGITKADDLAEVIAKEIIKDFKSVPFRSDKSDGYLDKEENFAVLARTTMPAVLLELGFIVNSTDAKMLRTEQDKIAETITKGILKYLGIKYTENKVKVRYRGRLLEVEGMFQDNQNYVSIRNLLEQMGHEVGWEQSTETVVVK